MTVEILKENSKGITIPAATVIVSVIIFTSSHCTNNWEITTRTTLRSL